MTDQPGDQGPVVQPPTPPAHSPAAPKKRALWKRILLWTGAGLGILLLLIILLGPPIISAIARGQIVSILGENLNGSAALKDFSFSWSGAARIDTFAVSDAAGRPVFTAKEIAVDISPIKAIGGTYIADVRIVEPIIVIHQDSHGKLNILSLLKQHPPKPPQDKKKDKDDDKLPTVKANVTITNGRISFVDAHGTRTEFTDVDAKLVVDTLDQPIRFETSVAGPGTISLAGEITVAKNGTLDIEHLHGPIRYSIDKLNLAALQSAVSAFAPITKLEGLVQGKGEYQLTSMTSVSGKGELTVDGLVVAGPAVGPDPVNFDRLALTNEMTVDATGTGTEKVRFTAGDFLTISVDAKTQHLTDDNGHITAHVVVDSKLKGLTDAAGTLFKLKSGYTLGGTVSITSDIDARVNPKGPGRVVATLDARLDNLSATDDKGKPLPIDPSATLALMAAYDPAGPTRLDRCVIAMGNVNVDATGGFDLAKDTVSDSYLKVDADLDDLAKKVSSFMDLGFSFGGKVKIDSTLRGSGEIAKGSTTINVSQFRLLNFGGKNLGPLDISMTETTTIDLRAGGRTTLDSFELRTGLLDVDATGEATDISNAPIIAGNVSFTAKAYPAAIQQKLGDFLQGYSLAGSDFAVTGDAAIRGTAVSARGKFKTRDLTIRGPTLGTNGAVVRDIALSWDASADTKTLAAEARDVTLTCASIDLALKDGASPIGIKNLLMKLSAAKRGDEVELSRFEFASNLATGTGSGHVKSLMKEGMSVSGKFDFRGDVAPLVDVAKAFVPDLKSATSSGTWTFVATADSSGNAITITPAFRVRAFSLDGYKVAEQALSVKNADLAFDAQIGGTTDGPGRAQINACTFTAPGLEAKATGTAGGFLGESKALAGTFHLDATLQPDELTRRASAFLMGYSLAGQPVKAIADVGLEGERYTTKGAIVAPSLDVTLPAPDPKAKPQVISQKNMRAEFDVVADLTKGKEVIDIKSCRYVSRTATASIAGRIVGLESMSADVTLTADAELAQVVRDLGAMVGVKDYDLKGKANASFALKGDAGKLKAAGGATVSNFEVTVPGAKPNEKVTVTDAKVVLTTDSDVDTARLDLVINTATLTASFLKGSIAGTILAIKTEPAFKGLKGDFTYIPDTLGAVLKPWLPGQLSGAEEQKVAFTLDGKAKEFDILALLRGSTGNATLGIGQFTMTGLAAKGGMSVDIKDQHARTSTTLDVNAGKTDIIVDLDLREKPEAVSSVKMDLKRVNANTQMSPILQMMHPLFGVAEGKLDGLISGKIDSNVDLSYRGPLTKELMTGGWEQLPKQPINGKGSFSISDLGLKGTPMLTEMLSALEVGGTEGINLDPISFTIKDGRLFYDRAVTMKLAGQQTKWEGSIGLDQTLDLKWRIPVTDKLIEKYKFLKYWKDSTIEVPVKGKSSSPRLQWKELMTNLAAEAAKRELAEKADEGLGRLFGGDEKEAKKLLEEADALWDQGKKADAAARYKKIYKDLRRTDVYKKNRDRVQQRMSG